MKTQKHMMKIKIEKPFGKFQKGRIITTPGTNGVPDDPFWRRRLKDTEHDSCVKIVKRSKSK